MIYTHVAGKNLIGVNSPIDKMSVDYRYIEIIHNMRKPVISSEISPKFDGVSTTCILPEKQLSKITK